MGTKDEWRSAWYIKVVFIGLGLVIGTVYLDPMAINPPKRDFMASQRFQQYSDSGDTIIVRYKLPGLPVDYSIATSGIKPDHPRK